MRDQKRNPIAIVLKNFNYEHDIDYALKMCRWSLKSLGIWPLVSHRTGKQEKVISTILLVTWFLDLLFCIIPPSCYMIFDEKNLYKKVKLFGPVSYSMFSTFKYIYLILRGTVFGRCIDHVERDWQVVDNPVHRNIMLKQASTSRHLTALCAIFIYTGGVSYQTVKSLLSKRIIVGNRTVKPLMYPGYDAFLDTQSTPNYEIIYSIHLISGLIKYSVTTAAFSLAVIFVTHICGQIQIQIERLKNLVQRNEEKGSRRDFLAVIVRDHVSVLRLARDVEEAFREICLAEIVESTLQICLLEYYCLMEWGSCDSVTMSIYFVLLTSFAFNIFIFCYIGQIMSEECSQIGPASYEIEWYNLPPKEAFDLILLSVISHYPPKLAAGKMFDLSLNTFVTVVQTSAGYLNLLRAMAY